MKLKGFRYFSESNDPKNDEKLLNELSLLY